MAGLPATPAAAAAVLALLLLPSCAADADAAALTPVSFSTPAQFVGALDVEDAEWALLLFADPSWSLDAELGAGDRVAHAFVGVQRPTTHGDEDFVSVWREVAREAVPSVHLGAKGSDAWSSVFVRADHLRVHVADAGLRLGHESRVSAVVDHAADDRVPPHAFRSPDVPAQYSSLFSDRTPAASVVLDAEGVRDLEVRGASVCDARGCRTSDLRDLGRVQETSSSQWRVDSGTLRLEGRDAVVLLGSTAYAVTVDGFLRLPDLRTEQDLADLEASVDGRTLRGAGGLHLQDLRASPSGTGQALLSTGLTAARLDESPVPVTAAGASVAATAALAALLLWKGKALASTLTGLFTRLDGSSALLHPNRRILFDYVDQNPGATFRELMRETRLAAGTMRHHLAVLMRCGVLVERVHGQTMRYFHQEQDHAEEWDAVVVLRQPDMDRIYRWLLENPGVMQRAVLDEAENWGWSRSTTQHRLKRLVDNDLARVRDLGRSKSYRARPVAFAANSPHSMGQ